MERERFDTELLDDLDPFELDEINRPHLAKHPGCDDELLYSMWAEEVVFTPGKEELPADWIMLAEVGGTVYMAALMPSQRSDPTKCRPIGLMEASSTLAKSYRDDLQ